MTFLARLRRPLVVLGVMVSLFVGVATIRAAAEWTAASAPLAVKPPSIESLQSALTAEQSRSADLQAQLDQLTTGSTELVAALETARGRIATDATQAGDLQTSLKAAKTKLSALERSIRQAQAAAAARPRTTTAPAPAATPQPPTHGGGDD